MSKKKPFGYIFSKKVRFVYDWTEHLCANAHIYNGLFAGLKRTADGTAKKPEKVIKEWASRTAFNFDGETAKKLCGFADDHKKTSSMLLKAAQKAGITYDTASEITLDELTVSAYLEWDGEELYPGDRAEIINPAWYQNASLLEQGNCKRI